MTWRKALRGALATVLFAIVFAWLGFTAFFSGSNPPLLWSEYGVFTRNNCGTYDRWLLWARGLHMPNGILGRDRSACK